MAAKLHFFVTSLAFLTLAVMTSGHSNNNQPNQCQTSVPSCFPIKPYIRVTLQAKNILQAPTFNYVAVVTLRKQNLLGFLEKAVDTNYGFRFSSSYFGSALGYMVDKINGTAASTQNQTFWQISSNGTALNCGVSTYYPRNNEVILFNFTTYANAGYA
ncbi:uncharacterized protein LOC131927733 [Physella acuta]|uniref:uncharacterized protein LOC131927733 n=1 Tax=Physella acuta TaxID=109671 RepID=UPI0027DE6211|nr:uncharacterized protein LOC131927733 [Physella acuta]XP_059139514.1 uncharacterized protein LOC131927733 [Physella acuta]